MTRKKKEPPTCSKFALALMGEKATWTGEGNTLPLSLSLFLSLKGQDEWLKAFLEAPFAVTLSLSYSLLLSSLASSLSLSLFPSITLSHTLLFFVCRHFFLLLSRGFGVI